ncbi:MAG: phytanoyl-CoA dioxygenase family protein [Armatimonadetes bacterium]|nr:phytanoyl-CoA dioxygenase family protein [Armatimonadota bacterium]
MRAFQLTDQQVAQFNEDGYLMVPGLFDSEEMDLLYKIGKADQGLSDLARNRRDNQGGVSKLSLRNDLPDDIYSAFVRSHRIVDAMERLLGGEVYHYHHKMMIKEPFVGGAWEWHQDYGYWYSNGCLFPYMASCMIAVDRATKENGCLQVLKGSHHMGRIEHGVAGDQTGADMERVQHAMERLELVYCEMEPGTALFFHSNLLHTSAQNKSPNPRWALICCYNAARNDPYKESGHPRYHYLEKWPDERIKEIGREQWAELQEQMGSEPVSA